MVQVAAHSRAWLDEGLQGQLARRLQRAVVWSVALEAPLETVNNEAFNVGQTAHNYRIRDLAKLWTELDDPRIAVINAVEGVIGDWVPQMNWRSEMDEDDEWDDHSIYRLDRVLEDEVASIFERWGIDLQSISPHTMCKTKALRIFAEGRPYKEAGIV